MLSHRMGRRSRLKLGALAGGGALLTACVATATPQAAQETTTEAVTETTAAAEATPAAAAVEPVTIRHGWWIPGDMEWARVMDRVATKFMEENPEIRVQVESSGWADYWQRVQVQLAGGEGIDVMWMSGAYFVNLLAKEAFLDLTPYVERDDFDYDLYIKQDDFFVDNKIWTMPYTGWGYQLLTYNMNAFDEAGLAYPTNEWTFDDWREAAIKLTKREGDDVKQWGQWIQSGAEYGWLRYMRAYGGNWINEEKTKTTTDDARSVEGFQWIMDQVFTHKVAPDLSQMGAIQQAGVTDPFYSGLAAMGGEQELRLDLLMTEGLPEGITAKPQVVLQPTPKKGDKRRYNGNTNPNTIWSGSKNQEGAWKWVLNLAGEDAMYALMETAGYPGMSVYKPLNEDAERGFLKPIPGVEWLDKKVIVEASQYWTGLDFHRKWMDWVNALQAEMDYAWLGERSAEEACKQAAVAGDQVLESA